MDEDAAKPEGVDPGGGVSDTKPGTLEAPKKPNFASTHRVKQLLETYSMTADKSMLGPEHAHTAHTYVSHLMAAQASHLIKFCACCTIS